MRTIFSSLVFVLGIGATSYSQHLASSDPTATILHMHDLDRQAHLKGDAKDLGSRLGDQILVISEGNITSETKEEMYKRFVEAFRNTECSAWEDTEQPAIRVSQDGTMAWGAFNVRSQYIETQPDGNRKPMDATISWLSTYEKRDGRWVMTAAATTYPSESQ